MNSNEDSIQKKSSGKLEIEEFEIGPIRPPSEGGSCSLLLRFTRNCSWNQCTFCYGIHYGRNKLQLRSTEEIKKDIDRAKVICNVILETSNKLGLNGKINGKVEDKLLLNYPEAKFSSSFITVLNWLNLGGKTAFLQDADTLIMRTPDLFDAIKYLKETFPSIDRITSYARSKTAFNKSLDELKSLKKAGLSRLHVGLETGDDELLKKVHKGVTAEQQIKAGTKIIKAGIELSTYIMPGIGGKDFTQQNAENTAQVLNAINPDYIRTRPLAPRPETPLAKEYLEGKFIFLSPHELLREIKLLVEKLTVSSKLCFDHALNPCIKSGRGYTPLFIQSYEGYKLPDEKKHLLEIIDKGLKTDESTFLSIEDIAKYSL